MLLVDVNNWSLLTFNFETNIILEESPDYVELLLQVTNKTLQQKTHVRNREITVTFAVLLLGVLRVEQCWEWEQKNWNSSQVAAWFHKAATYEGHTWTYFDMVGLSGCKRCCINEKQLQSYYCWVTKLSGYRGDQTYNHLVFQSMLHRCQSHHALFKFLWSGSV